MKQALHIGKAGRARFELPRDAVTQKLAFLGRTGTGKSYAAMKAAEEMHRAGAQIDQVFALLAIALASFAIRLASSAAAFESRATSRSSPRRRAYPLLFLLLEPASGESTCALVVPPNVYVLLHGLLAHLSEASAKGLNLFGIPAHLAP